jgi:hypothetical protein
MKHQSATTRKLTKVQQIETMAANLLNLVGTLAHKCGAKKNSYACMVEWLPPYGLSPAVVAALTMDVLLNYAGEFNPPVQRSVMALNKLTPKQLACLKVAIAKHGKSTAGKSLEWKAISDTNMLNGLFTTAAMLSC